MASTKCNHYGKNLSESPENFYFDFSSNNTVLASETLSIKIDLCALLDFIIIWNK